MSLLSPVAYLGMLSSASIANHLGYFAYETSVDDKLKHDIHKSSKILNRSFENALVPHFMQKIAQVLGNQFLGKYLGSALSSYGTSLAYMLFHKAMTANVNHEITRESESFISDTLPIFYENKVRPLINTIKEKIFGISETGVNYLQLFAVNSALLASTFLDKNISFPGTSDIAKAKGPGKKLGLTIFNKIAYMGVYFTYQALTMLMYGKKDSSLTARFQKLKENYTKVVKDKYVPPLSIAIADPVAELVSSSFGKIIPSPFIASFMRIILMYLGGLHKASGEK